MAKALDLYDKEEFYRCLQCAVCTGSCPSAQVVEGYTYRAEVDLGADAGPGTPRQSSLPGPRQPSVSVHTRN